MNLSTLTDDELVHRAWLELDPLYSTDLERELLARLEKLAGAQEALDSVLTDLDEMGVDSTSPEDIQRAKKQLKWVEGTEETQGFDLAELDKVLAVLDAQGIDNASELARRLDNSISLGAAVDDIRETMARLSNTVKE